MPFLSNRGGAALPARRLAAALSAAALTLSAAAVTLLPGARASFADLLLNEVLYDPAGPDEGAEFVELWNSGPDARSLAGVTIEAADGARPGLWTVIYRGDATDSVAPSSARLIGGRMLSGPLQNGPDAVRLARDGQVLDLLGYGDLDSAWAAETAPVLDVASGHSLARREDGRDTDSNAADWAEEPAPTPGRANHPDERLVFVPGSLTASPAVPWPGERVRVAALVANRGKRALDAARWRCVAEWARAEMGLPRDEDPFVPGAGSGGPPLAPGESVAIHVELDAPPAGAFRLRVRIESAPGSPAGAESLADTAGVPGRTIAGPAVVHEIAFRGSEAGEWVEIWFREPVPDVGSITLADATEAPRPVDRGPLPRAASAGALLVLAEDPPRVRARYGIDSSAVLGVHGSWPSLNDSDAPLGAADVVRVTSSGGIPSDVVPYRARHVRRGGSIERLSADLPGHLPESWGESVDAAGATPARPNSLRAPGPGVARRGELVQLSARVLRRSAGAAPMLFRVTSEARGRPLMVSVRDLLGRSMRRLLTGQRFASEGAFAWDGRDDRGALVRPGIYLVDAQVEAEPGAAARRSVIPIAVSAAGGER